jgi:hypothetical protein
LWAFLFFLATNDTRRFGGYLSITIVERACSVRCTDPFPVATRTSTNEATMTGLRIATRFFFIRTWRKLTVFVYITFQNDSTSAELRIFWTAFRFDSNFGRKDFRRRDGLDVLCGHGGRRRLGRLDVHL